MGNYVRVRVRYDVTQLIQGFVHSYNKDEKWNFSEISRDVWAAGEWKQREWLSSLCGP
jgi:hypothetical protein